LIERPFWKLLHQLGQGLDHGNNRPRRNADDDGEEQNFGHVAAPRFGAEELVAEVAEAGSKNRPGHLAGAAGGLPFARGSVVAIVDARMV